MTTAEKLLMIAETLHAVRGSWSVNEVLETASFWGIGGRRSDAYAALKSGPPSRRLGGKKLVPSGSQTCSLVSMNCEKSPINKGREQVKARNAKRRRKRATCSEPINKGREQVSGDLCTGFYTVSEAVVGGSLPPLCTPPEGELYIASTDNPTGCSSTFGLGVQDARAREKTKPKNDDEAAWIATLRKAVEAIQTRTLSSLTADERFALARYHAFRFANVCRDARRNKLAARDRVLPGLVTLAGNIKWGSLTVRQYVALGVMVRQRSGTPFYRAWSVVGEVEFEHRRLGPMWPRRDRYGALQLALELVTL